MKRQTIRKPTRSSFTLLRQLCNLIPAHLVPQLARDSGVAEKSRTFTPWSHVVSLIFAQLTHALGLNDVCDALRLNCGPLSAIRGARGPSKNGFSTANQQHAGQGPETEDCEKSGARLHTRMSALVRVRF